jgi:hypothetical protein
MGEISWWERISPWLFHPWRTAQANMAFRYIENHPQLEICYIANTDVTEGRLRHIRDICISAIEHDKGSPDRDVMDGLTDRQWLAQSILNILNGNIDAQILEEAAKGS